MKKMISILIAVMLIASVVVTVSAYSVYPDGQTSDEAVAAYNETSGTEVETHKYLFQMPNGENGPVASADVTYTAVDEETGDSSTTVVCKAGDHAPSWYNEYTEGAGIYWWQGPAACSGWAGYKALVEDADQCIFYANVPAEVVCLVWNNGIDGGENPTPGVDPADDIYYKAAQTSDVACEYPDPEEYDSIPEGADSFDNMIAVIDPDKVSMNPLSKKMTCGYNWYFYYGNGCYGSYATDSDEFTSIEENCCNPQHYVDGVHVGFKPEEPEEPTEPVQPTEPEVGPVVPGEDEYLVGDVNDSKAVDNRDAMILDRYVANWSGYEDRIIIKDSADLDRKGSIDNRDAMILDRVVAGWDGYYAKYVIAVKKVA